jgi:hypothetical protein
MSQNPLALPLTGVYSGTQAATDINQIADTLATLNSGSSAPSSPAEGWFWLDISIANQATLKIYDGSNWLVIGTLDLTNHRWSPPVGGGVNTIAGGGTTDLGSVYQAAVTISGTATITAFGSTAPVGAIKFLTFSGASVLTYNATSLILPTAANITTAAGDCAIVQQVSSGNWRVIAYQLASGAALSSSANFLSAAVFSGIISPTALAADTNDWAPTSFSTSETLRISASTPGYKLTGVAGGSSGLQKTLVNVGSFNITLTANDAGSTAANRFLMPFPIVLTPGTSQQFRYDGTSSGWRPVGLHASRTISGAFKNLKIINDSGAPTTTMDITADALTLEDSFGNAYRALGISLAPVMTASGANGLDTGSIVNNTITWYAIYVIYNPATGTLAGLYSLSASAAALLASGNMPSGYTFAMRVGWARTDGAATARWMRQLQYGRRVNYVVTAATNTAGLPALQTGNTGNPTTPTWTAVTWANFAPSTASRIAISAAATDVNGTGNSQVAVAPNNSYGGIQSLSATPPIFVNNGGAATSTVKQGGGSVGDITLESANIYVAINAAGQGAVYCMGWEDNL